MTIHDILQSLGISPSVLAAGTAGGVLRALSRKKYTLREMLASPICGALAAGYLTEPLLHYLRLVGWPLPPESMSSSTTHATAFLIGVIAMWIADIVLEIVIRRVRSLAGAGADE